MLITLKIMNVKLGSLLLLVFILRLLNIYCPQFSHWNHSITWHRICSLREFFDLVEGSVLLHILSLVGLILHIRKFALPPFPHPKDQNLCIAHWLVSTAISPIPLTRVVVGPLSCLFSQRNTHRNLLIKHVVLVMTHTLHIDTRICPVRLYRQCLSIICLPLGSNLSVAAIVCYVTQASMSSTCFALSAEVSL